MYRSFAFFVRLFTRFFLVLAKRIEEEYTVRRDDSVTVYKSTHKPADMLDILNRISSPESGQHLLPLYYIVLCYIIIYLPCCRCVMFIWFWSVVCSMRSQWCLVLPLNFSHFTLFSLFNVKYNSFDITSSNKWWHWCLWITKYFYLGCFIPPIFVHSLSLSLFILLSVAGNVQDDADCTRLKWTGCWLLLTIMHQQCKFFVVQI